MQYGRWVNVDKLQPGIVSELILKFTHKVWETKLTHGKLKADIINMRICQ